MKILKFKEFNKEEINEGLTNKLILGSLVVLMVSLGKFINIKSEKDKVMLSEEVYKQTKDSRIYIIENLTNLYKITNDKDIKTDITNVIKFSKNERISEEEYNDIFNIVNKYIDEYDGVKLTKVYNNLLNKEHEISLLYQDLDLLSKEYEKAEAQIKGSNSDHSQVVNVLIVCVLIVICIAFLSEESKKSTKK